MERFRLAPWGLYGGRAGTPGSCVVNRGTPRERNIGKVDVLHLEPGDVVSICAPAGGGYGDPRERDFDRVLADVRAGFLTPAQELERRWPPALQDAAIQLLESVPPAIRDWGKHQLYDLIQAVAAERPPTVADVERAWDQVRSRLARALRAETQRPAGSAS